MSKPFLLTLEYPPQVGGVAKYLEGEVKDSLEPVTVIRAQDLMWHLWPKWLPLLWRVHAPTCTQEGVGGRLWISHVLPIGYVALVWKWIYKTPYRVYLHGLDLLLPRPSKWKTFWVKIILQNADEIVVNSRATAKLLDYFKINPDRARVQYPRLDTPSFAKEGAGGWSVAEEKAKFLRQHYNIGNKPILLTVSRLVKRKGIDLVIKSLPRVWQEIPDLVYVVVGEGEERESLFVIASEAKQSQNAEPPPTPSLVKEGEQKTHPRLYARSEGRGVVFTGAVSEEEKYGWLSTCNCFILTPIDDPNDFEGYGIVYKEAQMFGKPVIGSRVGGVPEAVGDEGVLVEAGNIEQIVKAIINSTRPPSPSGEGWGEGSNI